MEVCDAMQDPCLSHVVATFQYFVSCTGEGEQTLYGTDALTRLLINGQKKHEAKQATLADLSTLQVFQLLLPPEAQSQLETLTKLISSGASVELKRLQGADARNTRNKKEKCDVKSDAMKQVLDMFK